MFLGTSFLFRCAFVATLFNFTSRRRLLTSIRKYWKDTNDTVPISLEFIYSAQHQLLYVMFPLGISSCMAISVIFVDHHFDFDVLTPNMVLTYKLFTNAMVLVSCFFFAGILASSLIYFILLSLAIIKRFSEINSGAAKISDAPISMSILYSIHNRHQKLCDMVVEADSCFGGFVFINFATIIPDICACIYYFMISNRDFIDTIIIIWWMLIIAVNFLSMAVLAAILSNAAHGSFHTFNEVAVRDLPPLIQGKISIILERLNGPVIGFSCLDLFVVTKGTLLNVIGVIATFFLTVLQIRVSGS